MKFKDIIETTVNFIRYVERFIELILILIWL